MSRPLVVDLTLPVLTLSSLLLIVAGATGWYVHRQQLDASTLLEKSIANMHAAEELEIRTREMRTRLNQFVVTGDDRHLTAVPTMYAETTEWLSKAERIAEAEEARRLLIQIRSGFNRFHARFLEIESRRTEAGDGPDLLKPLVGRLIDEQLTADVLIPVHGFLDLNQAMIARTIPVNQDAADRVGVGLAALGLLGAVAGLLAGATIARTVSRSLVQLSVPVHDAAGKLNEVVGPIRLSLTGRNIEELNSALQAVSSHVGRVVERLQVSQRETLRAEQLAAVGQLAAGMAHEIRNPLTAIKMIVQSAAEDPAGEGVAGRDLTVVYEQILRLEKSIQTFLDFARPARSEPVRFDLNQAARDSLELLAAQARRQQVRLESRIPSTPTGVLGDAEQLRQVIVNLVVNAIDAQPDGGQVRLQIERLAADASHAETALLTVADDGPGLPESLADRIFEPFVSTKETGVGLGLSICRRIVELHGGRIVAGRSPEGGARFEIRLPLAADASPSDAPRADSVPQSAV